MSEMFLMLVQESAAPAAQNPFLMLAFMVVFIAFFYFVVIRPQNKQRKEMQKMLDALKKGDKVVTIGGIIGKVASVKDNVVTLRVNDSNTELSFEKNAISKVVNAAASDKSDKKNGSDKDGASEKKIEDKSDKEETTAVKNEDDAAASSNE